MTGHNKTCSSCRKTFSSCANLKNHMNRKTPCAFSDSNLDAAILPKIFKFKCNRCESLFETNQNLTSHMNRKFPCALKEPSSQTSDLCIAFEQLQQQHDLQQQQIERLKKQLNANHNIDETETETEYELVTY